MNAVRQTQLAVIKALVIFCVVAIAVSFLLIEAFLPFVLGLVFGAVISSLMFIELGNTLMRAVKMPPNKAQTYALSRYFLRFTIYAIVLYISIAAPYIHVLGTVLGLVAIKPMIYITHLFNDKQYFKNIFKRKEDESNGR